MGPNVSRQQQDVSKLHQTHLNLTIGQGREKEMQQYFQNAAAFRTISSLKVWMLITWKVSY
jgi:hypothetical protein